MRLDHLPHGRLTGAVLVGLILALAVLIVAARGATTTSKSYYLALGDSITYGLQPTKAKPGARPSDFKTGYVDVVAARLRKRSSNLEVVNYGCPGRVHGHLHPRSLSCFRRPHQAARRLQRLSARGSARFPPRSPGRRESDHTDAVRQRLASGPAGHVPGKRRLRPEARPEGDRGLRLAVDVDHPEASRGRADGPDRRHGSVESGSESARGLESDLRARSRRRSFERPLRRMPALRG